MANDGRVLEARPGKGYCTTSIPVHKDGVYAALENVPLHRVVAYTFLGEPNSPDHTVDHINRVREDNRVANLRWASPAMQLGNREFPSYKLRTPHNTYTTLTSLARDTGIATSTLSSCLRHAQPGDVVEIQGLAITIDSVTRTTMAPPTIKVVHAPPSLPLNNNKKNSRKEIALQMFLEGATLASIATTMDLARTTVLNYIGRAVRSSTAPTLQKLAARLQLTSYEARQQMHLAIVAFHASCPSKDQYNHKYKDMVLDILPHLEEDWKIIQETFQALHKILDLQTCIQGTPVNV